MTRIFALLYLTVVVTICSPSSYASPITFPAFSEILFDVYGYDSHSGVWGTDGYLVEGVSPPVGYYEASFAGTKSSLSSEIFEDAYGLNISVSVDTLFSNLNSTGATSSIFFDFISDQTLSIEMSASYAAFGAKDTYFAFGLYKVGLESDPFSVDMDDPHGFSSSFNGHIDQGVLYSVGFLFGQEVDSNTLGAVGFGDVNIRISYVSEPSLPILLGLGLAVLGYRNRKV